MSYIQIRHLEKKFDNKVVLKDMDLNIQKGALTTLLGPSGCGKSTLLRSIAGLHGIDKGEIIIDNVKVDQLPPKDRGIGMVFQNYALFPNMNVVENISFGLQMKKMKSSEISSRVMKMIELVGLTGKEKAYPRELSGGQQQRVALARALVTEPKVLLLDEPLSALDAQIRKHLQNLLKSIQRELGITMVLVTHDQEEAMALSDYVYILKDGEIAQAGEPNHIYKNPETAFIANFIGNYNVVPASQFTHMDSKINEAVKFLAIRPETISTEPLLDAIVIKGRVTNTSMLGSIVRYEVTTKDNVIYVDRLNRSFKELPENEEITLYIKEKDMIKIYK